MAANRLAWFNLLLRAPDEPPPEDAPPPEDMPPEEEAAAEEAAGTSTFIASTANPDRAGDIVEQDWSLEQFQANPVILWAHRYDLPPVGRAVRAEVVEGALQIEVAWDEASAQGAEVARQIRAGFLSAVSVGFQPSAAAERRSLPDDDPRKAERGLVFSGNKLMEVSVCPVPMNAEALVVSRSPASASVGRLLDLARQGLPLPGEEGQLLEGLIEIALQRRAAPPPESELDRWFRSGAPSAPSWTDWFRD